MIKFSTKEIKVLKENGYETTNGYEFKNTHLDGDYETIMKMSKNEFDYYYTVHHLKSDIDRANWNNTVRGLTWEELKNQNFVQDIPLDIY